MCIQDYPSMWILLQSDGLRAAPSLACLTLIGAPRIVLTGLRLNDILTRNFRDRCFLGVQG